MFRSPYISLGQSLIFSQYKEFEALLIEIHGRRYGGRRLASNKANHFSDDKKTYRSNWLRTASYVKQFLVHWSIDFIGYFHFDAVTSIWGKIHLWTVCMLQTILTQITNIGEWQAAINAFQMCSTVIRLNFNQITVAREEFTEKKTAWC